MQPTTNVIDSIIRIIESILPELSTFFFGGGGIIMIWYTTRSKREDQKIEKAKRNAEKFDELEKQNENYRLAINAIIARCRSADLLHKSFKTADVTPQKFQFMLELLEAIEIEAEDVWEDQIYGNQPNRRKPSDR